MIHQPRVFSSVAFASYLSFGCLLHAQSTATPPNPARDSESPVVLLPYVVNTDKDRGYVAQDTAVGGKLATNLLETPADVSILTRDFLDDLAITNQLSAYAWLVNTQPQPLPNPDFGQNVTIRGLSVAANTRNYIRYDTTPPEFNTERLEQSRGPNSILFGDQPSGGVMNTNTKQAKFRDFESVRLRVDSEGSWSALLDVNRKIGESLAGRVNLIHSQERNWIDTYYNNIDGAAGDLNYRPWKNTLIRVEGETSHQAWANRSVVYSDFASLWDGVTAVTAPLTANPGGGLSRITTDRLVFSQTWNNSILNFRNFADTTGTQLNLVDDNSRPFLPPNFPTKARSFFAGPLEQEVKTDSKVGSVSIQQNFDNGFTFQVTGEASAINRWRNNLTSSALRVDANAILPNGLPNPNFGKRYTMIGVNPPGTSDQYLADLQIAAGYPLVTRWFTQNFSVIAERQLRTFDSVNYRYGRSNGPIASIADASNALQTIIYWDQASRYMGVPDFGPYNFVKAASSDERQRARLDVIQLNTVGHYLKNRLTLVAGLRLDTFENETWLANTVNSTTGYLVPRTITNYGVNGNKTIATGATYFPIKSAGVYFNSSDGFLPIQGNTGISTLPTLAQPSNVIPSKSVAWGLRFNLLGGQIVGSIGHYQSKEEGRFLTEPGGNINQIWTLLNKTENLVPSTYRDIQDLSSSGYEADFTVNFSKNFKLKANYSTGHATQTHALPGTIEYVGRYRAQWQAAADDPTNADAASIRNQIANVDSIIASAADGREQNGRLKYRANVYGNYRFSEGWFKNLSLGAGINAYGKSLIGNNLNRPYDYLWAKAYSVGTVTLGYEFKAWTVPVKLNLVVANVLDYTDPIYTSIGIYQNNTFRNGFYYIEPRKTSFTATVAF